MDLQTLQQFFMWCVILNFGVLMLWSTVLMLAPGFVYSIQRRWFSLSRETFDAQIFGFIGMAKIVWVMVFLVPWLALLMMG